MNQSSIPPISHKDNLAFIRLWTSSARRVHGFILALVLSRDDAEDILQEVAATAWEKFEEFDQSRDFVAWANGIARNKVLSSRHRMKASVGLSDELLSMLEDEWREQSTSLDRQLDLLRDCLARLPLKERQLLEFRYSQGLTVDGVSKKTSRSVAAVYKALQRIHDQLFDCISRKYAHEVAS